MTADDAVFLAIDAGTGSVRAIAFDQTGAVVARASREWTHRPTPGHPGGADFDTAGGWSLISSAVRQVVGRLGNRQVASIGVSSMREGFVLYDEHGTEIFACPNTDGRARRQAEQLAERGVAARIYELAGDWVSITAPSRLLWLQQERPDVLAAARHLGMLSDWVVYRLTGEFTTDPSCGSSSALFDLAARGWSGELADAIELPRGVLPEVLECGAVAGAVTAEAAVATGLPVGTPVVVGGADTQLALHGIGARGGVPTIVAGTFWQTTFVSDEPLIDPGRRLRTLCGVAPGTWMIEGINFLSGLSMRWFRDAFCPDATSEGGSAYDAMERWASAAPRGSNGLVAVLSNIMQADAWHHAAPAFVGFDINSAEGFDRGTFVRAIEEAAAYVARGHLSILGEVTAGRALAAGEVILTGGSSAGALWPQIIAEATGLTVQTSMAPEATAYGAVRLAAAAVGAALAPVGASGRAVVPSPEAVAEYDAAFENWRAVYLAQLSATQASGIAPLFTPPGGLPYRGES
ncbi:FGGY family carbohydrate kinase [Gryllotalpicola protaetiae]|uniref:FGGY family carbohydrate kinase n=1 Tax=Gryllotalpicola protaetiae TaxID=2419771 RepID=UPI0013C507E1|nr:FGGY family carbohydrate kinase [Gryllotalpicola protaetiae]